MRGATNNFVRACVAFALALLPVLGGQGIAQAHAIVVSTSPAGWEVVGTSPAEVSLTFSEPVELGLATVRLLGPEGDTITTAAPAHAEGKNEALVVSLPRVLSDGTYTVNWQVTSADTHPVHGAFMFSVGQPSKSAATTPVVETHTDPDLAVVWSYGTARWLSFAGLALLAGAAFFAVWCQAGAAVGRRVRVLLSIGWYGLLAATALVLVLYGPYATGRPLTAVFDPSLVASTAGTRLGLVMLARLVLLGLVGVGLLWFVRRADQGEATDRQRGRRGATVLAATGALAFTWSAASHSGAGELVVPALVADAAHLTAMAVWLGGLVVVGAVVVRSDDVSAMRVAVPRFSRVALVSVIVLVVTGVFQSWRLVGTPSALIGTSYGRVLLGKVALAAVLLALGAAARRWVQRHYGAPVVTPSDRRRAARGPGHHQVRRFGTVVAAEAGIAALVLGLTAALVNTNSAAAELAAEHRPAATRPTEEAPPLVPGEPVYADFDAGGAAGRGKVAALVSPGAKGGNEVHLAVFDERGQPKAVAEVRATLSHPERSPGPVTVPLHYGGVAGHYISDALFLPVSGRWEMSLNVRTSDVDEAIVHVSVGIP